MPPKKAASNQRKERVVPVRVMKTDRPARSEPIVQDPASVQTSSVSQQKRVPPMNNKRKLMWAGVVVVSAVILVLWVGYMKQNLSASSNSNDSFFTKIGRELKDAFNKLKFPGSNKENANDRALNELRNSVFPDINIKNTNAAPLANTNVNENINGAPSTNTTVNVNSATNTVTP